MKSNRVETAKKYGPEHRISLKTGLYWPKLDQNDQNVSKFKNLVYLSQKIPIIDPNHPVIMYRHEFGQKMVGGYN